MKKQHVFQNRQWTEVNCLATCFTDDTHNTKQKVKRQKPAALHQFQIISVAQIY